MKKEEDKFEIPVEEDDLKIYFRDLKFEKDSLDYKKGFRSASKQFQASVLIVDYLLNNENQYFQRTDLIIGITGEAPKTIDQAAFDDITIDSYKHAIRFLESSLIITNEIDGKTTLKWGFNPNLNIHIPKKRKDRFKKAHLIVSSLSSEINYINYKIATDMLASKVYDFSLDTFYGKNLTNDKIPVCDPEIFPYWREEMEVVKQGGYNSKDEFNKLMYEKTGDDRYLSQMQKDAFAF